LTRLCITGILLLVTFAFFAVSGCDKEKITESTEYIHDIEYVELPPDTVLITDTVFVGGSDTVNFTDTLYIYDTTFTHDTIVTVITDTVLTSQCAPNEYLALSALQYYSDPLVLDLIYQEFGITGGWVFYLSAFQLNVTQQSSGVYDLYGYIDYWTDDWSAFYALEFYWRLTYTGGEPADPDNWQMTDPPGAAPGLKPGINIIEESPQTQPNGR